VLDTASGQPAAGLAVTLLQAAEGGDAELGRSVTDADGRVRELGPATLQPGTYRLVFDTAGPFFPEVIVTFCVERGISHYHIPLLLSPFGYATYRGS
jgi:5-hydroxyisourate hydrolase